MQLDTPDNIFLAVPFAIDKYLRTRYNDPGASTEDLLNRLQRDLELPDDPSNWMDLPFHVYPRLTPLDKSMVTLLGAVAAFATELPEDYLDNVGPLTIHITGAAHGQ